MIKGIDTGYDISNIIKIAEAVTEVLNINRDVYIVPMKVMLDDNAYVTSAGPIFTVFINPKTLKRNKINAFNIKMLIHELTHVQQAQRGDLVYTEDNKTILWKGEEYDNNSDYDSRPFEIEARKNESIYFKKIKELLSL